MTMLTALETLIRARAVLARPYAWTKGQYSQKIEKGDGMCYCAVGAMDRALLDQGHMPITWSEALRTLAAEIPESPDKNPHLTPHNAIVQFNDAKTTKKKDVLALFDRAIARLQAQS